jgi:hypothetical protein
MHLMGQKLGLAEEIDARVQVLKRHLPYHESDHVLNLAYNCLLDGLRLEDIELRRNDEAFLDGLGAQRIPDPTTSGDFTRRFDQDSVVRLMEAINAARQRGLELVRMEFRRFLHAIVLLPAQIVRSGSKIIYRIMGYNSWLKDFFAAWENLRRMAPA